MLYLLKLLDTSLVEAIDQYCLQGYD